jgi:choline dehydrogenase-like flavoprotein
MTRTDPIAATMSAEIVVVGSGPGGAITAALCAEAGKSVLLIEEGRNLPLQSAPHFSPQELIQKYRNAGITVAMGRQKVAYVEGRCVGGGSEINRGLYHRTPDYVLDAWRKDFGVKETGLADLEQHFEACEGTARVEYLAGAASLMSAKLDIGAKQLGWRSIETPRLYHYGRGPGAGRKQSMSETFVPRFLAASGQLLADTFVSRISKSGDRWKLKAEHSPAQDSHRKIEIIADKVFIACGAVQTPALLRRSGIRTNIGNSLRFHPMLKLVAEFNEEVNRSGDPDPVHQIKEFEPLIGMGCSISKRPLLALAMAGHADHSSIVEQNWLRMGLYYVQTTGGSAKVRNLPFFRDPLVTVRHTTADLRDLGEGLKRLAEALFAAGAIKIYPGVPGYPVLSSMEDARKLPALFTGADGSLTSVHVFSSCPMGENTAVTATDSFGRVRDANGLYIADASLLCGPTSVNPQGTVMAIAHRNALRAIEDRFR